MSERYPTGVDRVRPSLLDLLTAPAPTADLTGRFAAGTGEGERAGPGALREVEFRDTILRDIEWLFNANPKLGLTAHSLRRRCPYAVSSVLNFGLRGIFGTLIKDPSAMERRVLQALNRFEPRIVVERQALRISKEGQLVEIEIEGTLLTQRAARHLVVRTDLETESSRVSSDTSG